MDVSVNPQERFWAGYYAGIVKGGAPWLDYSNDRVQAQTFGLALEAAGPVGAKQCVDIGCGLGDFCLALSNLRASGVTGVDLLPEVISRHAAAYPHIRWIAGSLHDPGLSERLGSYDIAFLLEVLQYASVADALSMLWRGLLPSGRIVAVVPNASCPIVARTRARFEAQYSPPTIEQIVSALGELPDLEYAAYRGLSFSGDQRLVPYEISSWRTSGGWGAEPPNRIQFVAVKRGTGAAR